MTQLEWQQLEDAVASMTDDEKRRLADLLVHEMPFKPSPENPSLGLFADEPELIDEIMKDVYIARETHPLRAAD